MKILEKLKNEEIIISFIIMVIITSIIYPKFLTTYNIFNLAREVSIIGLISLGMTLVIISGGIDLSVGSTFAVVGVTLAQLSHKMTIIPAIFISLLVGILIGALIGVIITKMKIEPFIVTLSGLMFGRGLAYIVSGENTIKVNKEFFQLFQWIGRGTILGIPISFVIFFISAIILTIILNKTQLGRTIYAVGSNFNGAQAMGLKVDKAKLFVYIVNGFFAGLAGIIMVSKLGSGQPSSGNVYELKAILSVVIGGTLITGGVGKIRGTVIGIFILTLIENIFNLEGLGTFYRNVILGIILLAIVILQKGIKWRKNGNK